MVGSLKSSLCLSSVFSSRLILSDPLLLRNRKTALIAVHFKTNVLMDKTDQQLVRQTLGGDVDAFNKLALRYQGAVYGLTFHWTRNFADAQDLTQETFFQAYEKLGQLREHRKFAGWLNRIATNLCHKWLRTQSKNTISIDAPNNQELRNKLAYSGAQPAEALEAQEQQTVIQKIFDLLSDKVRLTATLFYLEDLSYQEISHFLDVPISTIKSRLHKARTQLKKEAIQMVEETFGQHRDRPKIEIKKVSGYVHLQDEGFGYLRPAIDAPHSSDDIFIAQRYISLFDLKAGDFIHSHARPTKNEQGENGYSAMRFERINHEPAVSQAPPLKENVEPAYSDDVKEILKTAREIAAYRKNGYVGTEHLLMGILKHANKGIQQILADLQVNVEDFRQRLEEWIGHHTDDTTEEEIRFTPRAKDIVQATANEASARNTQPADIEHLLLALARDKNSAAALVLWDFNLRYEELDRKVSARMNS